MDQDIYLNKIDDEEIGRIKKKLPKNIIPIKIGEQVFLFKWAFYGGWQHLKKDEEAQFRRDCEI